MRKTQAHGRFNACLYSFSDVTRDALAAILCPLIYSSYDTNEFPNVPNSRYLEKFTSDFLMIDS